MTTLDEIRALPPDSIIQLRRVSKRANGSERVRLYAGVRVVDHPVDSDDIPLYGWEISVLGYVSDPQLDQDWFKEYVPSILVAAEPMIALDPKPWTCRAHRTRHATAFEILEDGEDPIWDPGKDFEQRRDAYPKGVRDDD